MSWNWVKVAAFTALVMGPWNFGLAGDRPVIRAQGGMVYPETYPVVQGGEYCQECEGEYYEGEVCEECEGCYCSPFYKICHCWNYITTLGGKPGAYPYGSRRSRVPRSSGQFSDPRYLRYSGNPTQPNSAGSTTRSDYYRDPRQLNFQYLYRYQAPKDLVYPAANQPAGVVVYPYYTLKGPDDFFLDKK